ncbi:superoxide dismutase [Haloechinothrix sp. LS1_15]|uniref:superoxide dismutase n=1 Tax=Haloechinothrix sp. LS1_15 TaxID=2652248 RepID=UPI00294AE8FD|nr:superoxide dismutase [Haloechinothrix sp. LS1_15]
MRTTAHRDTAALRSVAVLAALGLLVASCGNGDERGELSHTGTLAAPEAADDAYTYDSELAPEGAELTIMAESDAAATEVTLRVSGLLSDRGYAVHAHTDPCGTDGGDSGPHYQHEIDPAATPDDPSTDPEYANPDNEIWLDVVTDDDGDGEVTTEVPFGFAEDAPESIVLHQEPETATEPGEAGTAGDRVACLTVPFGALAS